jgi:hypothetical protein
MGVRSHVVVGFAPYRGGSAHRRRPSGQVALPRVAVFGAPAVVNSSCHPAAASSDLARSRMRPDRPYPFVGKRSLDAHLLTLAGHNPG